MFVTWNSTVREGAMAEPGDPRREVDGELDAVARRARDRHHERLRRRLELGPDGAEREDLVELLEVHGVPDAHPVLKVAERLGPVAQHLLDRANDLALRDLEPRGMLPRLRRRDARAHQRLERPLADAHELAPARHLEHVRRVVGQQVPHPRQGATAARRARLGEAVEPRLGLLAVADPELQHVDLVRQLRPLLEPVEHGHEALGLIGPEVPVGPPPTASGRTRRSRPPRRSPAGWRSGPQLDHHARPLSRTCDCPDGMLRPTGQRRDVRRRGVRLSDG
jgi:hypothetical protein